MNSSGPQLRWILPNKATAALLSGMRSERFIILNEQPRIDTIETADKGYSNQNAALAHHKQMVAELTHIRRRRT